MSESVAQAEAIPAEQLSEAKPPPPSRVSKFDLKRQKIFQERMQRLISKGMTPDQAIDAIQREDYERLPVQDKVKRLEGAMFGNFRQVAQDIGILRHNQNNLADVMDVNFRAFEKMLAKLGVAPEEQKEFMKQAEEELKAEYEARQKAEAAAPAQGEPPPQG